MQARAAKGKLAPAHRAPADYIVSIIRALLLTLPVCLAACSAVCRVTSVATLPISFLGALPTVPVKLDGHPATMVVDTGAPGVLIDAEAATSLQLPTDGRHDTLLQGFTGGVVGVPDVQLDHLDLGGVDVGPLSAPRAALSGPSTEPLPVAGLIGADVLARYDVELDFPARTMTLHKVDGCTEARPTWPKPYASISARVTRYGHLAIPALLDGHLVSALFDTGSSASRFSRGSLSQIGLTPDNVAGDPEDKGFGLNGVEHVARLHRFESLVIGGRRVDHPEIGIVAGDFDDADMLIGMDVMRTRRFWLSYSARRIFMQISSAAVR